MPHLFDNSQGQYQHHKVIHASQGIKISAADLDKAVPGSSLLVVGPNDNLEDLKVRLKPSQCT